MAAAALLAAAAAAQMLVLTPYPRAAALAETGLQALAAACLLRGAWRLLLGPACLLLAVELRVAPTLVLLADGVLLHGALQLRLFTWFAGSLRRGREPLVAAVARRVHGGRLRADVARYTRGVTIAWSVFFAGEMLASATVLLLALAGVVGASWWWRLVARPCLPLTLGLFVAEYVVRRWRIRDFEHVTFLTAIRVFRAGAAGAS